MKNRFKYILLTLFAVFSVVCNAQDANKILDKTSAKLKAAGNVKIGFTISVDGNSSVGYIKLQGQKFVCNTGGNTSWFDGKTMWTYVKSNDEVTITTPNANDIAKMNPYAFITFYKKGYKAAMGASSSKEYEVILTGTGNSAYSKVVLHVNKSTYMPASISMTSAKGNNTNINVNSLQKGQKYTESTFVFNKKNYPTVEVVDLR